MKSTYRDSKHLSATNDIQNTVKRNTKSHEMKHIWDSDHRETKHVNRAQVPAMIDDSRTPNLLLINSLTTTEEGLLSI
jgi:hypothetical protein